MSDETLEQKVARLEKDLSEGPSRTGTPRIPAALVPWLNVVFLAAGAAAAFLGSQLGATHWSVLVSGMVAAIALALMANGPGLRQGVKVVVVCLLGLSVLTASSCTWWKKVEPKLLACTTKAVSDRLPSVLPAVGDALQGDSMEWQGKLEALAISAGIEVVGCALEVIIKSLESGTGGAVGAGYSVLKPAEAGGLPPPVLLLRAYQFTEAQKLSVKK